MSAPERAHLAARLSHMGRPGAGQVTQLANRLIVAQWFPVLAEAIRLAEAGGVDGTRLPEALCGGFADSIPFSSGQDLDQFELNAVRRFDERTPGSARWIRSSA